MNLLVQQQQQQQVRLEEILTTIQKSVLITEYYFSFMENCYDYSSPILIFNKYDSIISEWMVIKDD